MKNSSLSKRYASKLFANIIGLFIGVGITFIIPRALGPIDYGNYSFLTASFVSLIGFFTFRTEACFYVRISQRPEDNGLIAFYARIVLLVSGSLLLFVVIIQGLGLTNQLWLDQSMRFIYMGAAFSIFNWLFNITNDMMDAYALTIRAAIFRIIIKAMGLGVIFALYLTDQISLTKYFFYNIVIFVLLIGIYLWNIHKDGIKLNKKWRLSAREYKRYLNEFYFYSRPLYVVAIIGMSISICERWLLQYFGGSNEQGYYGLALQISSICIIFTTSLTSLIMREFSIQHKKNNINEIGRLYKKYIPMLYSVSAFISCFIFMQVDNITRIVGGGEYSGASLTISLMALYPIHQTLGQLNYTLFLSTDRNKLFSKISIIFSIIGLPVIIILLAPIESHGLNLGASGLAIKMLLIQIVAVNIQLYYNASYLSQKYLFYLLHQFGSLLLFVSILIASKYFLSQVSWIDGIEIAELLANGFFYFTVTIAIAYKFPSIIGLRRGEIDKVYRSIIVYLFNKKRYV